VQLFVLGMHRSGISSVTRLLDLAGVYVGPEGISNAADEGDPTGFWERPDIRATCDALLHGGGFDWWRVSNFSLDAIPGEVRDQQLGELRKILLEIDAHRPWVITEPRLSLLFALVRPLLEVPVCIHVTREPLEVAQSLSTSDAFPAPAGLALWELYTVHAFRASEGLPRLHVRDEDVAASPVEVATRLVGDLRDLGVRVRRVPTEREIQAAIRRDVPRRRRPSEHRGVWLNRRQMRLVAAIDDGSILQGGEILDGVSESATATLAAFEDDCLRQMRLETLEAELSELRSGLVAGNAQADELQRKVEALDAERARLRRNLRKTEIELERVEWTAGAALEDVERRLRSIDRSRSWRLASAIMSVRRKLAGGSRRRSGPLRGVIAAIEEAHRDLERSKADEVESPAGRDDDRGRRQGRISRRKVAVVAWDVGHNPVGRAHVLAGVLERRFDVEIWGAQFPRYGTSVWAPLAGSRIPIRTFDGHSFPAHLAAMREVAQRIDADAIYVSKPRLPSYGLGVFAKQVRNRPLVLDVDDHELAFFNEDEGLDVQALLGLRDAATLELPFYREWTRACEPLIDAADGLTVSNRSLQARYGGLIVPHARDERVFDPELYDRDETRRRLGVDPSTMLLLFGGTPRLYKGILELLQALDRLGDDRYRLMLFGTRELNTLRAEIGDLDRWLLPLPYQPFAELPRIVGAADLACVLQDPDHPVSRYQVPAKITDALAMGVPCLVRPMPPLRPIVDKGVLDALEDGDALPERIAAVFDNYGEAIDRAREGRKLFEEEYSYDAVSATVGPLFERVLDGDPPPVSARLAALTDVQIRLYGSERERNRPPARLPGRRTRPIPAGDQYDVVMFWKQNDTGIYGRRQDMFVKYLERSGAIRSIVHFDKPTTPEDLYREYRRSRGATDHRRLIVRQTIARILRRQDTEGTHHYTFVHAGDRTARLRLRPRDTYIDYIKRILARHRFGSRPTILWAYPTNDDLPDLIDALDPDLVVTDVVDDHRTFAERRTARYESFERNYREVLARSDIVIANCTPVGEAMKPFAPAVHVVPNGLELRVNGARAPRPNELAGIDGPIIGYVGNLSQQRIDVPLVESLVRARPKWQFVFVGSAHHDRSVLDLESRPNVHFVGVKPYEETLSFIEHFDVAIVPHVDNEMTRSMNPLKAFVYCSTGVPVVSTPVANLGELEDLITIAGGPEGFLTAIERALREGRREPDVERLAPHSWERRVEQTLGLIGEAIAASEDR
jgi:glycosyltransferase involved in cell wall biosynthesis